MAEFPRVRMTRSHKNKEKRARRKARAKALKDAEQKKREKNTPGYGSHIKLTEASTIKFYSSPASPGEYLPVPAPSAYLDHHLAYYDHPAAPILEEGDINRTFWYQENLDATGDAKYVDKLSVAAKEEDANLVSSLTEHGLHAPALDIDFPIRVVESSTPGHFHLYIEKEMTWPQYQTLLQVLGEVGILEQGYVETSLDREMSMLRKEGQFKPDAQLKNKDAKALALEVHQLKNLLDHRDEQLEELKTELEDLKRKKFQPPGALTWG